MSGNENPSVTAPVFAAVLAALEKVRGIDFTGYRHEIIKKRISSRMNRLHIHRAPAYADLLQTDPRECETLLHDILINASWFFRGPMLFDIIENILLPEIIATKKGAKSREIRIWSAGCAAGEEPYSMAILVHRILAPERTQWKPYIFATDIDTDALERAGTGAYPRESLESTRLGIIDTYFTYGKNDRKYRVKPFLKDMVFFSRDDCTSLKTGAPTESVFGTFDMVLCRNVLIYFSQELQKKVLAKINKTIAPRGYLILGDSEYPGREIQADFFAMAPGCRIFKKIAKNHTIGE